MHREGDPILIGEGTQDLEYLADSHRAFGSLGGSLRYIQEVEVVGAVDYRRRPDHTPVFIDKDIAHYREDPALEIGIVGITGLIVKYLECSILE